MRPEDHLVFIVSTEIGLISVKVGEIHFISVGGSNYTLILVYGWNWFGRVWVVEIDFISGWGIRGDLVFGMRAENDLLFGCERRNWHGFCVGCRWICFQWGVSNLTWFDCRNENDLAVEWVVGIELMSMWGSEMNMFQCRDLKWLRFCVAVENYLFW